MRNVVVFQKGNSSLLTEEILNREVLTCWMVNNHMPNTIIEHNSEIYTTGNAPDSTLEMSVKRKFVIVIVMEKFSEKYRRDEFSKIVFSDEKCRGLYDECYLKR